MGTRSATGSIDIKLQGTIKNAGTDGVVSSASIGGSIFSQTMANGVSANQWNRVWSSKDRVITAGNSEDFDVYDFAGTDIGAGAGNDALGQSLAIEEIVAIAVVVTAGAGSLEVMPSNPTNHWTSMPNLTVARNSGLKTGAGFVMWSKGEDGFDVEDGVSHRIRFKANGAAMTYSIFVFARHDDEESSSSSTSSQSSSQSSSSSNSSSSSSGSSSSSSSTSSQSTSSSSVSSVSSSSQSSSTSTLSSSSTSTLSSSSSSSP